MGANCTGNRDPTMREEERAIVSITEKLRFGGVAATAADNALRKFSRHHLLTQAQLLHVGK
jgi:hypothetical protein